jgi:hypothetical protein
MIDPAIIEREALNLDPKARGRLAARLLESLGLSEGLEQLNEGEINPELLAEIVSRSAEWDADPSVGLPFDDAIADVRRQLGIQ